MICSKQHTVFLCSFHQAFSFKYLKFRWCSYTIVLTWPKLGRISVLSEICIFFYWMHHMDVDKTHSEKVRLELHKISTCYIEQILEATFHKTTVVWPPIIKTIQIRWASHVRHCWRSKDKHLSDVLLWNPLHRHANVGEPTRPYPQQLCTDIGFCLEDIPGAMDDGD